MRSCARGVSGEALPIMNGFNETEAVVFPMQTMLPDNFSFSQIFKQLINNPAETQSMLGIYRPELYTCKTVHVSNYCKASMKMNVG